MLIRYQLSPLRTDVSQEERVNRAWVVADLCEGLPLSLDPARRARIFEGVEYLWRTASAPGREWMRARWDEIGYDYSWLPVTP